MLPAPTPMLLGLKRNVPAVFVASGKRSVSGDSSTLDLGAALEGDLAVVLLSNSATIAGGDGGWTYSSVFSTSGHRTASKLLSAGDITGPLTCSGYPWVFGVYRIPVSETRKTSGSAAASGPTLAGFTKGALCAGLLGLGVGNTSTTAAPSFSAPWTVRETVDGGGLPRLRLYDLLTPDSYTDGASIPMGGSSNGTTYGAIEELTDG